MIIRAMVPADYDGVYALWMSIKGFSMRSLDDSKEGVTRFLERNPSTSVVAIEEERIVGAILCGQDGRRGCLYHVCVADEFRMHGIGISMVKAAMEALKAQQISKVTLIAFQKNIQGNEFWKKIGWTFRDDINYYEYTLNEENIATVNN